MASNTDKLMKRLLSAHEELIKFHTESTTFRNWMEKAFKILEDKEKQLANLNKAAGNPTEIKNFVTDVLTHRADLKFLTISGQKFVELSKVHIYFNFCMQLMTANVFVLFVIVIK